MLDVINELMELPEYLSELFITRAVLALLFRQNLEAEDGVHLLDRGAAEFTHFLRINGESDYLISM